MTHTWTDYTSPKYIGVDRRCARCGHDYATDAGPCPVTMEELQDHIETIVHGIDGTGEINSGHLGAWWHLKQASKCAGNDNLGGAAGQVETAIERLATLKALLDEYLKESP